MGIRIGVICEGASDYRILKHITERYLSDIDAFTVPIQPKIASDGSQDEFGGWEIVLRTIEGEGNRIIDANIDDDFIITQIDTDVCHEYGIESKNKSAETLFEEISILIDKKLPNEINSCKIIKAISINSIECWLIPYVCQDEKKCLRTNNCLNVINNIINKKDWGTIDASNKNTPQARQIYDKILSLKKKPKDIKEVSKYNYGFSQFIFHLDKIRDKIRGNM